jgi:ABC-type antimicrobial peptide transport system permease subunit
VGTAAGVLFAIASAILIEKLQPLWIGVVSWPAVVIALVVSILIGVSFGFFPARRAGRLDPVEAIRR